jgi:BlaI family penicillinase repressor
LGSYKKLTALEWEIMDVVWKQNKEVSVREVLIQGYPGGKKAYTTVQTVMNHLVEKGYLNKKKLGLVNFYKAAKDKNEIIKNETSGFVKKVYNGSFKALANYILDSNSLSAEEIADLKNLIAEKEEETKKNDSLSK